MELRKEMKKKVILDAAEKIIAQRGFLEMTMDQVAREADVAKGTVYIYFKNKNSLCTAVNARLNREMNEVVKEKMDLCKTGSEKIVASGTGVVEFSLKNPQKWNVLAELHQMKFEDPTDPNVLMFLQEVNDMVQMMAEAYMQGMEEGAIRRDLDPVATSIFNRMAFSNVLNLTTEQKMLLELNNIDQEHYLGIAWGLMNRSTHIKPSIREETEKPVEQQKPTAESMKEIKNMVDSMELKAEDAMELFDSWEKLARILLGNFEYEILKATEENVLFRVKTCPMIDSLEETGSSGINLFEGCSEHSKAIVETLNPNYTQRFTETMCKGGNYCESIIELKNEGDN
jgi:AcrR family transcriptional regulator